MNFKTTLLATTLAVSSLAQAELSLKIYHADANSFSVTSTLVMGEKEALLIDSGFTRADALRIAANILDSGKTLNTILVSQADPDYYFGVETLKQFFPEAKVVATPAVRAEIEEKLATKLAVWTPQMGSNAPKTPVIPTALEGNQLQLEGETLEIRGTQGVLANRPYVWIPALKTITGNVAIYGDMHLWTADSQSPAARAAWLKQLEEMKALQPKMVIPGHMAAGTKLDASAIDFSHRYLTAFEKALASSKTSQEVIAKMEKQYPNLADKGNLELGAKVNTGEMKW